jgi:4-amino-4-deoxy-L-arabinose transferase-like glycosyltransferase
VVEVSEARPSSSPSPRSGRSTLAAPLAIIVLAMALRVGWAALGPKVIESEGSYYARVADNLAAGRGYLGIRERGLQLLYPPLYPLLTATGIKLGCSPERAGRLVSLLAGICFPLLAFFAAGYLYGRRAGVWAGALAAAHPLLVVLSSSVLTESLYLTLALLALFFAIRTMALRSRWDAAVAGVAFGLAYLTRPEALILTGLAAAVIMVANRERWRTALWRVGLLAAAFELFALPYAVFLYRQTGQLRFEAKTADAVVFGARRAAGELPEQIYFSVDHDLHDTGVSNMSNLELLKVAPPSLAARLRMTLAHCKSNLGRLLSGLGGLHFGAPFFEALVALGLFATAWQRHRLREELPLLAAVALTLVTFGAWTYFHDRFLFPLLVPAMLWAGRGVETLTGWTRESLLSWRSGGRVAGRMATAAGVGALLLVALSAAVGVREIDEVSDAWSAMRFERPIAAELRRLTGGARIRLADTRPTVAFYSNAVQVPYPWTDEATALRYLESRQVDYLVLRDGERGRFPYMPSWLDAEVPAGRCTPVGRWTLPEDKTIRLCRWRRGDAASDVK